MKCCGCGGGADPPGPKAKFKAPRHESPSGSDEDTESSVSAVYPAGSIYTYYGCARVCARRAARAGGV
jgi:hypothetical protein